MILRAHTSFIYKQFQWRSFSRFRKLKVEEKFVTAVLKCFILPSRTYFFEPTPRGIEYPEPPAKYSLTEHFHRGRKMFPGEFKMWINELSEKFRQDYKIYQHGDTEVILRFDKEDSLEKWSLSSDKANKEGNSDGQLVLTNNGKALFFGNIDNTPTKDGKARRAGFCAIRSKKLKKSFQRANCYNWEVFSHLELRVRGDGRTYTVFLGMGHSFDVLWLDLYMYHIFTRGGPYWETIKIPFSKFYLTSKGRIQDKQEPVSKLRINSVGIQCSGAAGPFRIEIDYVGVHVDHNETEKFAYEIYTYPKTMVSN